MASADRPGSRWAWRRTWVDERPALYASAGEGLPVLFLHGWALGDRAYRRSLERLVALGCRVVAPALPGFGGTADLPARRFSLTGYASWVDRFCDAVDLEGPVFLIGHSFGGGVAIKVAHDHPERVRTLVLVNSIGGSAWRDDGVIRSMAERPLWDWGVHFPADIWPVRQASRVLPVVLGDAVPNLVRNPRAVIRVASLARRADLTRELEELKRRQLPVVVLWGTRDGVIPRAAFDSLCTAIGAEGAVVDGSHSWLLADPDQFGEVMTNVLAVAEVAQELEAADAAAAKPGILDRLRSVGRP